MLVLISAAIVATAIVWAANAVVGALGAHLADRQKARTLSIIEIFAAAVASSQTDPRTLVTWQPLARAARAMCPEEFATLDRSLGGAFPFSASQIESAHAQWTADWLAWERAHDTQYRLRAAEVERKGDAEGSSVMRARLDAIEREKLDLYQRRYEEYIRVAKALQALSQAPVP